MQMALLGATLCDLPSGRPEDRLRDWLGDGLAPELVTMPGAIKHSPLRILLCSSILYNAGHKRAWETTSERPEGIETGRGGTTEKHPKDTTMRRDEETTDTYIAVTTDKCCSRLILSLIPAQSGL